MSPAGFVALAEIAFGVIDRIQTAIDEGSVPPEERDALLATLNTRIDASYQRLMARRPLTPADQVPAGAPPAASGAPS